MTTLNPFPAAKATVRHRPLTSPLNLGRSSFIKPLSFRPPVHRLSHSTIKASVQRNSNTDKPLKLFQFDTNRTPEVSGIQFLPQIKTTLITTVTAAAIFFARFYFSKPAIAAPISPPTTVEATKIGDFDDEREKSIEEHLLSNPNDIDALKNLMEIKIKSKRIPEAIAILDKLTDLEPEEIEWPMLKAHLYSYNGETELAKNIFSELIKKDPFRVDAYHGLITVASQDDSIDSSDELYKIEKKVEEAMKLCKKENRKSEFRDFKLLIAQMQVVNGKYDTALKVYQELVKEEPRDFRPYLCQGIIYTLLKKSNEAEKSFEKYRRLVPKGHPYASYFDDNMIATKIFAQKVENERNMAKS